MRTLTHSQSRESTSQLQKNWCMRSSRRKGPPKSYS